MRWTTIGLSAGHQYALTSEAPHSEAVPAEVSRQNRIASVWIPAILGIGLLTTFGYLGVRIVAAKSTPTAPAPQVQAKLPAVAPTTPQPPEPQPQKPAPQKIALKPALADFTVITPQPGERYLQVVAVSPHMVLTYVDILRKLNLEPVVAPGPTPDLLRILVGPFADPDSMEKARAQLISAGKSPIVRLY